MYIDKISIFITDISFVFTLKEQESIQKILQSEDIFTTLKKLFNNSLWINDEQLSELFKKPLLRVCAWYLYKEKRRSYALNNVGMYSVTQDDILVSIFIFYHILS